MKLSPRICVSIGRKNVKDALAALDEVAGLADVFEIRLDCLQDPVLSPFFKATERPLLFTNRPRWEGGQWNGEENERVSYLIEAVEKDAAYVDLELLAPDKTHRKMESVIGTSSTRMILSWHNFSETPAYEELEAKMVMMQDKGADLGKIITTAHDHLDVLRLLRLQELAAAHDFPLISFCMGAPGIISRVATCELGGYMTYCCVKDSEATAPGQLSAGRLRQIYKLMNMEKNDH